MADRSDAPLGEASGGGPSDGAPPEDSDMWTVEEDLLVQQLVQKYGRRWAKIKAHLPGRTDNAVRHRWNRIQKGDVIRQSRGQDAGYRCRRCGLPKKGHICAARTLSEVPSGDELQGRVDALERLAANRMQAKTAGGVNKPNSGLRPIHFAAAAAPFALAGATAALSPLTAMAASSALFAAATMPFRKSEREGSDRPAKLARVGPPDDVLGGDDGFLRAIECDPDEEDGRPDAQAQPTVVHQTPDGLPCPCASCSPLLAQLARQQNLQLLQQQHLARMAAQFEIEREMSEIEFARLRAVGDGRGGGEGVGAGEADGANGANDGRGGDEGGGGGGEGFDGAAVGDGGAESRLRAMHVAVAAAPFVAAGLTAPFAPFAAFAAPFALAAAAMPFARCTARARERRPEDAREHAPLAPNAIDEAVKRALEMSPSMAPGAPGSGGSGAQGHPLPFWPRARRPSPLNTTSAGAVMNYGPAGVGGQADYPAVSAALPGLPSSSAVQQGGRAAGQQASVPSASDLELSDAELRMLGEIDEDHLREFVLGGGSAPSSPNARPAQPAGASSSADGRPRAPDSPLPRVESGGALQQFFDFIGGSVSSETFTAGAFNAGPPAYTTGVAGALPDTLTLNASPVSEGASLESTAES